MQAATEERALQYASIAHAVHPLLADTHAEPTPAVEVPLMCCGRHLVLARMPVSRRAKVRWSAEVLGISLAVQVRAAPAQAPPPHSLHAASASRGGLCASCHRLAKNRNASHKPHRAVLPSGPKITAFHCIALSA